jgi:hypothetical protein
MTGLPHRAHFFPNLFGTRNDSCRTEGSSAASCQPELVEGCGAKKA